jgi:hypothetical protein
MRGFPMLESVSDWLKNGAKDGLKGLEWLIVTMDVTQWGIVSAVFVVLGFLALRSRH